MLPVNGLRATRTTASDFLASRAEELRASLAGIATPPALSVVAPTGSHLAKRASAVALEPNIPSVPAILASIAQNRTHVVSFPGTSQYECGGASACGLIGINLILKIVKMSLENRPGEEILLSVLDRQFLLDVSAICTLWDSESHMEVEELYHLPLFRDSLEISSSKQDICKPGNLEALGRRLLNCSLQEGEVSAALITKTPEILTMLSIPLPGQFPSGILAIYDSHTRRSHPNGAGLIFGSPSSLAKHLTGIFHVDSQILSDTALGWQAELLLQFSVHVFRPRADPEPSNTAYASTEAILKSRALLAKSLSSVSRLEAENARLRGHIRELEMRGNSSHAFPSAIDKGKAKAFPIEVACVTHPATPDNNMPSIEMGFVSVGASRSQVSGPSGSHRPDTLSHSPPSFSGSVSGASSTQTQQGDEHYLIALKFQNEINAENERLAREREELMRFAPQTFDCGICMDTLPKDDIAVIDGCGHKFCREDMRNFVASKLSEHRFPIVCPNCSVDESRRDHSVVSEALALQLGLTEEQYAIWSEMQMSSFATMVHCRRCKRTAFIDKKDHDRSDILNCPLPNCIFAWCKTCNQAVEGGVHSCDGTAELDSLMRERGYKHCPGCQTPISRTDGCAHMQCTARGCNTHFCYRCGELIVRSARRSDIQAAMAIHYRRCLLFDYGGR